LDPPVHSSLKSEDEFVRVVQQAFAALSDGRKPMVLRQLVEVDVGDRPPDRYAALVEAAVLKCGGTASQITPTPRGVRFSYQVRDHRPEVFADHRDRVVGEVKALLLEEIQALRRESVAKVSGTDHDMSNGVATHFRFVERIGSGGYADVWRAKDLHLDRDVALKIFRESAAEHSTALQHAKALARLTHANVLTVHAVVSVHDPENAERVTIAVVTELVHGGTLAARLKQPISAEEALRLGIGVVEGVAAIHAAGLVHMDLHDENVMVTSDGAAKVIDILYRGTVAVLPTARREHHIQEDVRAVGAMLRSLVDAEGVHAPGAEEFRRLTRKAPDLDSLRLAFHNAIASGSGQNNEGRAEGLLRRFQGLEGRRRLTDQLLRQAVVANDRQVAEALSNAVTLRAFEPSEVLVVEGAVETEMHLLLAGEVIVEVHGREVAKRKAGQHIGEMALIDPAKTRSATVRAVAPTVSAVVSEEQFTRIAADHAEMWRRLALELGERLRGRGALVPPRNAIPQVLIMPVGPNAATAAETLRTLLQLSGSRIETQVDTAEFARRCRSFDFVIAIAAGADIEGLEREALTFRMAVAIGAIGSERTLLVMLGPRRDGIPQHLHELRCFEGGEGSESLVERLRPVADEIRQLTHVLGSR
jgi:CRP-like cAMP-binding protein